MGRMSQRVVAAFIGSVALAVGCHTLLDIDEVSFGDGTAAGIGGGATGGSGAGTGGQSIGGSAGSGGSNMAGGATGGAGGAGFGWSTPQRIDALSEVNADDDDPTFTADLLEVYIDSDRAGLGDSDIYVSTRATTADQWSTPTPVPILNSSEDDTNMAVGPGGLAIWFGSARPGGQGSHDIYVSFRLGRSDPWPAPIPVDELNSADMDQPCAVTEDTLTMVLHSTRNGSRDLFVSTRSSVGSPWSTPVPIAELNTSGFDWQAWLSPDGLDIYFGSDRNGPSEDLFVASRASLSDTFAAPAPLSELNSSDVESDPWLSPDQSYMMFSHGDTNRDIYETFR